MQAVGQHAVLVFVRRTPANGDGLMEFSQWNDTGDQLLRECSQHAYQ